MIRLGRSWFDYWRVWFVGATWATAGTDRHRHYSLAAQELDAMKAKWWRRKGSAAGKGTAFRNT